MSYENYHHYTLATYGQNSRHDAFKGGALFIFMVMIMLGLTFISGLSGTQDYTPAHNGTLFSCIEYDESYMTCSLGNLK